MSQAPMMPVWPDALLGDTLHLSTEQFGAYLLLLFATWRNNGKALPDNDRILARICRSTVAHWRRALRPTVIEFFDISDGSLHQKRLESEWNWISEKIEINKINGAAGGRATALKILQQAHSERPSEHSSEQGSEMGSEIAANPYPIPLPRKKRERASPPAARACARGTEPGSATRPSPKILKKDQEGEAGTRLPLAEIPEGWLAEAEAARDDAGLEAVNLPLEWLKFATRAEGDVELRRWIEWSLRAWVPREPQRHANGSRGFAPAGTDLPEAPWAARMRHWRESGWWQPDFGPKPNEPGCFVPPQYLATAAEWADDADVALTKLAEETE